MTDRTDDLDFQRFTGAFDAPVAPSPVFAARQRELMRSPAGTHHDVRPMPPASHHAELAPVVPLPSVTDTAARSPVRWRRGLEAAVAAVLVVALIGAAMQFARPERPANLAFQADPANEVNYGGNPGRTWVLGDTVPETGGATAQPDLKLTGGADSDYYPYRSLVVGDSLVYVASEGDRLELVLLDLSTGEEIWTTEAYITGSLASDGERLYAVHFLPKRTEQGTEAAARITAFSLATGKVVWEGPQLANRFYSANAVALAGGVVYATDYLGNVLAVNKSDGTMVWQYPDVFATPPANEQYIVEQEFVAPPEIAVSNTAVFVGQPSKTVLKLDRTTGEVLGSINLVDRFGADIVHPGIQATNVMLVVTAVRAGRQTSSLADETYYPATLLVFDSQTLDLRTSADIADLQGNAVVADDAIFVAAPATPYADANLYRMDLDTGDLGSPIGAISAEGSMLLSASGGVLMAISDPSTVTFFDMDSGEQVGQVELGITNMETPFSSPVQMWGANPIVVTGLGDVYVIEDATG